MISIVVSSHRPADFANLQESISATIGVAYEIVQIHNPGLMGICEAYNRGAALAKYEFLCFVHEDVEFLSINWGRTAVESFTKQTDLGLLGLAGSAVRTFAPSPWGTYDGEQTNFINIVQGGRKRSDPYRHVQSSPTGREVAPVVCVDGVWLFTKKEIWSESPFDAELFRKYHCYDIDFSLSVGQRFTVAVTQEILLNHFSEGNYDDRSWIEETIKLYKKWEYRMPAATLSFSSKEHRHRELASFHVFIRAMKRQGFRTKEIRKQLFTRTFFRKMPFASILKLYRILHAKSQ